DLTAGVHKAITLYSRNTQTAPYQVIAPVTPGTTFLVSVVSLNFECNEPATDQSSGKNTSIWVHVAAGGTYTVRFQGEADRV
ncbi:MAG TPA: hypothetical protein VNA25_27105, partial [Phycisphaerae bacterium]|nr:hypothetical protein [Phycisphaerae bacterium]